MRSRSQERSQRPIVTEEDEDEDNSVVEFTIVDGTITASNRQRTSSYHKRAQSDPFDSSAMGEVDPDDFHDAVAWEEGTAPASSALPTFQRFPSLETKNKNCWSEPPVSIFQVRGPNYFDDKKKVNSAPYLLQGRGVDLFLTEKATDLDSKTKIMFNGKLRRQPTIGVDFSFPWGNMILYYQVPNHLEPYLLQETNTVDPKLTTAEQTLARWLLGDTDYKNERLKLIPFVAEGPWVVRNMVTGRPAIIGKKLKVSYKLYKEPGQRAFLRCTLDIGSSSATAKRIVSVCRRYMSALTVDIGFVIQAETQEELPEQMMGSLRIHGADPLSSPKLT